MTRAAGCKTARDLALEFLGYAGELHARAAELADSAGRPENADELATAAALFTAAADVLRADTRDTVAIRGDLELVLAIGEPPVKGARHLELVPGGQS